MKTITPRRLSIIRANGEPHQLVDVREDYEVDSGFIGGVHIPMDEVLGRINELKRDIPVVLYCKSGKRAAALVHVLTAEYDFNNVCCLEGGVEAYATEINPGITVYG